MIKGRFAQVVAGLGLVAIVAAAVFFSAVWASDDLDGVVITAGGVAIGALLAAAILTSWHGDRAARQALAVAQRATAELAHANRRLEALEGATTDVGVTTDLLEHRVAAVDSRVKRANVRIQRSNKRIRKFEARVRTSFGRLQPVTADALDVRMLELVQLLREIGTVVGSEIDTRIGELATRMDEGLDQQASAATARADQIEHAVREAEHAVREAADLSQARIDGRSAEIRKEMQRTEEQVRRDVMTAYAQLEALFVVYSAVDLEHPLPEFRGWAVSPDLAAHLVRLIDEREPDHVVEVGSGLSTVLMGLLLAERGGKLTVLEHLAEFAAIAESMIRRHGIEDVVRVVHAPLKDVEIEDASWPWYDLDAAELSGPIDLMVVDGPPQSIGPHARYPAVPLLFDRLAPNATIVLDDAAREEETEVVDRWLEEFPEFDLSRLDHEKGTAVLTRLP